MSQDKLRSRRHAKAPGADDPVRPKKVYRMHYEARLSEYGADKTTPSLSTPAEVSSRVKELMEKLKNAMMDG